MKAAYRLFASLLLLFYVLMSALPVAVFAQSTGNGTLIAAPASGTAPLAVTFTATWLDVSKTYVITYGDGTVSAPLSPQCVLDNTSSQKTGCTVSITHTYAKAGSFTATTAGYTAHVAVSGAATASTKPTCQIWVTPSSISVGGSVTVRWQSANATAGAITNIGNVGPTGSYNDLPSSASLTTYFGSFTGPGGAANCQASVAVNSSMGGGGSITTPNTNPVDVGSAISITPGSQTTQSSGLVPCGFGAYNGNGADHGASTGCQACDLATLIQKIMNFAIGIAIPIAAALFAYAGFLYITSAAKPGNINTAKEIFKDALIGFVIAITAWLVINTFMHVIFSGSTVITGGSWFTIPCATQNRPVNNSITQVLSQLPIVAGNLGPLGSGGTSGGVDASGNPTVSNSNEFSNSGDLGTCPAGYQYIPDADTCSTPDGSKEADPTFQSFGSKGTCAAGFSYSPTENTCVNNQDASQSADPIPYPFNGGTGAPTGNVTDTGVAINSSRVTNTNQYSDFIQKYAADNNVDPATVQGIMAIESSGNANTGCNNMGACGLMQVKPGTACETDPDIPGCTSDGKVGNLTQVQQSLRDPETNIAVGTEYYAELVKQYGNTTNAIAAYNGGPGAIADSKTCPGQTVWECTANSGYLETRNYVPSVLKARTIVASK